MNIILLKPALDKAIADYIEAFEKKHDIEFDGWVADETGGTAFFDDGAYNFDFQDIRKCLEQNRPKGDILYWYVCVSEINYKSWITGAR